MQVRALCDNPDGIILPGLFARVRVLVVKTEKSALLIPEVAIGYDQLGAYVLTVDPQQVVQRKGVQLGIQVNELRVIEEGVSSEDRVVENGLLRAIPGNRVKPKRNSPNAPGAESGQTTETAPANEPKS